MGLCIWWWFCLCGFGCGLGDCGWFFIAVLSVVVTGGVGGGVGFVVCSWCAFALVLCVYLINVVLLIRFCGY